MAPYCALYPSVQISFLIVNQRGQRGVPALQIKKNKKTQMSGRISKIKCVYLRFQDSKKDL